MRTFQVHMENSKSFNLLIGKSIDFDWIHFLDLYSKEKATKGIKDLVKIIRVARDCYWDTTNDKEAITNAFRSILPDKILEHKPVDLDIKKSLNHPLVFQFINSVLQQNEEVVDYSYYLWSQSLDLFKKKTIKNYISKSNFFLKKS